MPLQMILAVMLVAAPYVIGSAAQRRTASDIGEFHTEICTIHGTMKVDVNGRPIVGPGHGNPDCCHLCVANTPQVAFGSGFSVRAEPGAMACVRREAIPVDAREKLVRRLRGYSYAT